MTLDEALSEAVAGARVRTASMPEGCYVEHLFSKGFVRCWPVDHPENEPNRTQCEFRPHGDEVTGEWSIVERVPVPLPPRTERSWDDVMGDLHKTAHGSWTSRPIAPTASKWGNFDKPAHAPAPPVEFCGECDFEKSACVCPKPEANKWGTPKKESNKWGQ